MVAKSHHEKWSTIWIWGTLGVRITCFFPCLVPQTCYSLLWLREQLSYKPNTVQCDHSLSSMGVLYCKRHVWHSGKWAALSLTTRRSWNLCSESKGGSSQVWIHWSDRTVTGAHVVSESPTLCVTLKYFLLTGQASKTGASCYPAQVVCQGAHWTTLWFWLSPHCSLYSWVSAGNFAGLLLKFHSWVGTTTSAAQRKTIFLSCTWIPGFPLHCLHAWHPSTCY